MISRCYAIPKVTALGHMAKDQYAGGLADQFPIRRVKSIKLFQSPVSAPVNLGFGMRKNHRTHEKAKNRQSRSGRE